MFSDMPNILLCFKKLLYTGMSISFPLILGKHYAVHRCVRSTIKKNILNASQGNKLELKNYVYNKREANVHWTNKTLMQGTLHFHFRCPTFKFLSANLSGYHF